MTHKVTSQLLLRDFRLPYLRKIRNIENPTTRKLCANVAAEVALMLCNLDDIERKEKGRCGP